MLSNDELSQALVEGDPVNSDDDAMANDIFVTPI